ncbi:hypothetical protein HOC13_02565 [Candidatus Woesearchaeota archaeon]|jgi:chromosome segregation ATPase|nr:hypothetical protein [Candidatus Woesearchaeota archaeon]
MFGLRKRNSSEPFHQNLQEAFGKVKEDVTILSEWIKYFQQQNQNLQHQLHQQNQHLRNQNYTIQQQQQYQQSHHQQQQHHQQIIQDLHTKVSSHRSLSSEDLSRAVDQNPRIDALRQRMRQMEEKIDLLLTKHGYTDEKILNIHEKIAKLEELQRPSRQSLKEKIVKTFSRSGKTYLKNLVFSYIQQHKKISALQLKDIVVDQQGLTSKSSFYRILEEIEQSEQITTIRDGKQKFFILKTVTTP